jgi:hypothetical protein
VTNIEETWRDISGFGGTYQVSDVGRVRSSKRNYVGGSKILCLPPDGDGYPSVALTDPDGVKKTYRVHRLVAKTFIPNPEGKPEVNHKDGRRKDDCSVSNLEWVTKSENAKHAFRTGLKVMVVSEDGKQRISEARRSGRIPDPGKKVEQIDPETGAVLRTFRSIREASVTAKCSDISLGQTILGNRKSRFRNGFLWRFAIN